MIRVYILSSGSIVILSDYNKLVLSLVVSKKAKNEQNGEDFREEKKIIKRKE
jgi:hypothetical protein